MKIVVNGEEKDLRQGISIKELIEELELGGRRVAVELNREIVPREFWTDKRLDENDAVEIVQFVGGG